MLLSSNSEYFDKTATDTWSNNISIKGNELVSREGQEVSNMEQDQGKKFKERWYDLMVTANCESKKEKDLIEEVIEKEATVNTEDVG